MTEISYVWDGVVTGDATLAPYTKEEFNRFSHLKILGDLDKGYFTDHAYVIPGYLGDLRVERSGDYLMSVTVNPGAALINNYVYISDAAITLPIDRPTTGYRRIDRIILRLVMDAGNLDYQTVRVAVLTGTEKLVAEQQVETALTQNALIWEVLLARVLVENPATYTYIADGNVHDMRNFVVTDFSKNDVNRSNLIKNSEFMAYSGSGGSFEYPEHWWAGGIGSLTLTNLAGMVRGNALYITTGTLAQDIPVASADKTYTLRGSLYYQDITGESTVQVYGVREDGTNTTKWLRRRFQPLFPGGLDYFSDPDDGYSYNFQESITFDEDDIKYIRVAIVGSVGYVIGQMILVAGYHPGPLRPFSEVLPYRIGIVDAAWTTTAKSTGTTTINLSASFGSNLDYDIQALILRLRGRDSGSAAGTPYMRVTGYAAPFGTYYGTLDLAGTTNDVWREIQVIVPVYHQRMFIPSGAPQFRIEVSASGAGTFDATVEIVGIIT